MNKLSDLLALEEIDYSNRLIFLRELINASSLGLEIGPGNSPIFPRRLGYHIKIVDVLDKLSLKQKFEVLNADISQIEKVDFIWKGEPLDELIGDTSKFQYIMASHVLEHIPNPIAFFYQCEKMLADEGVLILAIPDKRKCFDFFRPLSTTGQFIQAYMENAKKHALQAVYDFHAAYVTSLERNSWFSDSQVFANLKLTNKETLAYHACQESFGNDKYFDVHGWVFSPSSFLLIYKELHALNLLTLQLQTFSLSNGHEFYAVFKKRGKDQDLLADIDRLTLYKCMLSELYEAM